jgi:hypothetical protein
VTPRGPVGVVQQRLPLHRVRDANSSI